VAQEAARLVCGAFAEGMKKIRYFPQRLAELPGSGVSLIGMDHFAKEHDELAVSQRNRTLHRNFQGYTTKAARIFTVRASTAISGIQETTPRTPRSASWEKAVQEPASHHARHRLSQDDINPPRSDQPPACATR